MQTIKGKFSLKLMGIPIVFTFARLLLESERGNYCSGTGIVIGPFLVAVVNPLFKPKK